MREQRTKNEGRRTERRTKNRELSGKFGRRHSGFCASPLVLRSLFLIPFFVLCSLFFVLCSAALSAQRSQPIYPAYDGFLKNPDGSYTLSFAYFSHNAEVVTIPPGADNSFAPAPGDRMQPTTFKPGHWRFQCVMVVGPEFDGKMRWSLTYGGTTTGTSERMLQSNWNLVEGAPELSRLDYAKVPRGVCLNRAPTVRLLGKTARKGEVSIDATTAEELHLFGSVADEGLPRTAKLLVAWKVLKGPGNVRFSDASAPRTTASFTTAGTYELELSATDSELSTALRVIVTVV
jgi:hypothetical protein